MPPPPSGASRARRYELIQPGEPAELVVLSSEPSFQQFKVGPAAGAKPALTAGCSPAGWLPKRAGTELRNMCICVACQPSQPPPCRPLAVGKAVRSTRLLAACTQPASHASGA